MIVGLTILCGILGFLVPRAISGPPPPPNNICTCPPGFAAYLVDPTTGGACVKIAGLLPPGFCGNSSGLGDVSFFGAFFEQITASTPQPTGCNLTQAASDFTCPSGYILAYSFPDGKYYCGQPFPATGPGTNFAPPGTQALCTPQIPPNTPQATPLCNCPPGQIGLIEPNPTNPTNPTSFCAQIFSQLGSGLCGRRSNRFAYCVNLTPTNSCSPPGNQVTCGQGFAVLDGTANPLCAVVQNATGFVNTAFCSLGGTPICAELVSTAENC